MPSKQQLLTQMVTVIDGLIDNATRLNEIAKRTSSESELEPYQSRQDEILRELAELDRLLKTSDDGASKEKIVAIRKLVHDKLLVFQKINEEFLSLVSSHFRLIHQKELPIDVIRDLM
jgi:hypothetical protein